jgi:regulatory protein
MKLTAIKSQKNSGLRFSIFVDDKYSFSLSQPEILKHNIKIGMEITSSELKSLKAISGDDRLYVQTLKLVAARPKSEWEVKSYLQKKGASPALIDTILNKLRDIQLVDDFKFAEIIIRHYRLQSPASRRKILSKLRQKRVSEEAINQAMSNDDSQDIDALKDLIRIKTKQSKYSDQQKLMAYLSRQGFNYSDIKSALGSTEQED